MADKSVSERVSATDETKLKGYFNTKKEMIYKNIIWDLMYKTQKQGKAKKDNKKRATSRTDHKVDTSKMEDDHEKKKRRLSSKINYDVLERQRNGEFELVPEQECLEVHKRGCKESENNEEKSVETQSFGKEGEDGYGDDEVEQYENEYGDDSGYGNLYCGNEDEDEGFNNYEEDCDYEQY